jgi:hypothetical protein
MQKGKIGQMFSRAAFSLVVDLSGIRILLLVEPSGNQPSEQSTVDTAYYYY